MNRILRHFICNFFWYELFTKNEDWLSADELDKVSTEERYDSVRHTKHERYESNFPHSKTAGNKRLSYEQSTVYL